MTKYNIHQTDRSNRKGRIVFLPILLAGFLLLFQACQKEEEAFREIPIDLDAPIAFHEMTPVVEVDERQRAATRAAVEHTDDLTNHQLWIFGWHHTGTINWTGNFLIPKLNPAIGTLKKIGTANQYDITYSPSAYYYVQDYKYNFLAVYPANVTGVELKTLTTGEPYVEVDILQQNDIMTSAKNDLSKSTSAVTFYNLNHRLAQVTFKIKKSNDLDNVTVLLNKLSLEGVVSGRIKANNGWDKLVNGKGVIYTAESPYPGNFVIETTEKEVATMLLYPVDNSSNISYPRKYTFTVRVNEHESTLELPRRPALGAGETIQTAKWTAGRRYVYTLTVTSSNVYLEVDSDTQLLEEDWTTETNYISIK